MEGVIMPDGHVVGVYEIRCLVNQKVYVGQSVNVHARWLSHRWHLNNGRHGNAHLQAAWDKYGPQSFIFSVVQCCAPEDLSKLEEHYIQKNQALSPERGYNLEQIQDGVKRHTPETRLKISLGNKGKIVPPQSRARIAAAVRGRVAKPETLAKMRLAGLLGKGKPKPEGFGQKISEALKGRSKSEAHRDHISQAKKGKPLNSEHAERSRALLAQNQAARVGTHLSEETKTKIGNANRGRKQTDEEKARRSAATKGKPKTPEQIAASVEGRRRARNAREISGK
jgi:group I intron endonuclease